MADWQLQTPIAFIIFNRPAQTEQVFETIRQAKPPVLLVVADGPRPNKLGEAENCAAAREIIDRVDWDCQVLKNYSETNLGCRLRVSSGLDWVFDTVEEAIILEDDCVPHPTFFPFCEELLEYYRHDCRIGSISGQNVQFGRKRTEYSYYFSRYTHCWGWASWRRAWKYYDLNMTLWPEVRDGNFLMDILGNPKAAKDWEKNFQIIYDKQVDTWDYQWTFTCWIQTFLTVLSNVNLVTNIGYGTESTHTSEEASKYSNMAVEAMDFPLKHPPFVVRDLQADEFTENTLYDYNPVLSKKIKRRLKEIFKL
jgi:hypothetical protein